LAFKKKDIFTTEPQRAQRVFLFLPIGLRLGEETMGKKNTALRGRNKIKEFRVT